MIRELHLQNFKCFEDQKFRLRPLTLLTGLNGTGKSSVLQSLLLLRQSYQQGLLPATGLALNGDLIYVGTARDALFEGAKGDKVGFGLVWKNGTGKEAGAVWHFRYPGDSNGDDATMDLTPDSSADDDEVYQTSLFTDEFQYLQAERVGPRRFFEIANFVEYQRNRLGSSGEYTASFLLRYENDSFWDDFWRKELRHQKAVSDSFRHQIEAWLGEISPGVQIKLASVRDVGVANLEYAFDLGNQISNTFRSMNVGFGITYALPIIVSVLTFFPEALLLIENPEAHLHPRGQAAMGRLLALAASSGIQVLVETHSDHVLNGIRVAVHDGELNPEDVQIHFFQKREEDGRSEVISPQIDRDGRLDQWPDGFFDEFDKSLEVLLQPRKE